MLSDMVEQWLRQDVGEGTTVPRNMVHNLQMCTHEGGGRGTAGSFGTTCNVLDLDPKKNR